MAIQSGEETLKMYAEYNSRMSKLVGKTLTNLGCEEDHCGMGQ